MDSISTRLSSSSSALIVSEIKPNIGVNLNSLMNFGSIYTDNLIGKLGKIGRSSLVWSQRSVLKASQDFSGSFLTGFDIDQDLKDKGNEVSMLLNGRNVNLIGHMGAGKSTLGKVLAELLCFTFVDSDKYVEQSLGGKSIADIFKQNGEKYFRYHESEALRTLSSIPKQVVGTGGGAAINRANWRYMKRGVTIFLDVPLHTLALRVSKDRHNRRPILEDGLGNEFTRAFRKLHILHERRKAAYANADVAISYLCIAKKLGLADVSDISTTALAMEVLIAIEIFLQRQNNTSPSFHMFLGH